MRTTSHRAPCESDPVGGTAAYNIGKEKENDS